MKDAYYFSHDGNARNDPKILMLRAEYKAAGYAHYFMILEMMREAHDYKLPLPFICQSIAIVINETPEFTDKFICRCCDLGLFIKDTKYLLSESLLRRMDIKENLSKSRSESGRLGAMARWQNNSKVMAVKESKGKESKGKTTTTSASEAAVAASDGLKPVNWVNCKSPIQRIIARYVELGQPALYAHATQAEATALFKVQGKAVGPILEQCGGDVSVALRVIELAAAYYGKKGLDWSLYAVSKNCGDFLNTVKKEQNYGTIR